MGYYFLFNILQKCKKIPLVFGLTFHFFYRHMTDGFSLSQGALGKEINFTPIDFEPFTDSSSSNQCLDM